MARLLIAVVAVVLLAGCGGEEPGGGSANPLAVLDAAVARSGDVESFRFEMTMDSDLGGQMLSMEGSGTSSADSTRARMTASMDTDGQRLAFEGIATDGVMYLRSENDDFGLPPGKEWVRTPDPPTSTLSPSEFTRFLRESPRVERVGEEEIRGRATTHFRGPLDMQRLAEESGAEIVQRLRETPGADSLRMTVDIWVGPEDLPARVALEMTAPEETSGGTRITMDVLEYDVPVDAEPPPKGKVADAAAIGGG